MIKWVLPLWVSPCMAQRTATHLLTFRSCLCSIVPWLLAFLARSLSNPREEADGLGFLCTNQGGICSLTDTSPLTHVSSHIHYSSSPGWAAVKGRVQSGGWAGEGEEDVMWGDERLSCSAPAANSSQYSSGSQSFIQRTSCKIWVKLLWFIVLFLHTLYFLQLFSSAEWLIKHIGGSSPGREHWFVLKVIQKQLVEWLKKS